MQINRDIHQEICSEDNLLLAWIKARRWKTKRRYVKRFQKNLKENLLKLREENANFINKYYSNCYLNHKNVFIALDYN